MAQPSVSQITQDLYDELSATGATRPDEALDWPLLRLCQGIMRPFEQVDFLVRDTGSQPGWAALLDADLAPAYALPWLAQMAGAQIDPASSEAQRRSDIKSLAAQARGSIPAMTAALRATLTGNKYVTVVERDAGNTYRLTFNTKTSETPNPAASLKALQAQKPAGLLLGISVITGASFQDVKNRYVNFQDMRQG